LIFLLIDILAVYDNRIWPLPGRSSVWTSQAPTAPIRIIKRMLNIATNTPPPSDKTRYRTIFINSVISDDINLLPKKNASRFC
jgi:hypothetical protein